MSKVRRVKYWCEENDNHIILESTADDQKKIEQLLIGDPLSDAEENATGWTVIGYEDLRNALALLGYYVSKPYIVSSTDS